MPGASAFAMGSAISARSCVLESYWRGRWDESTEEADAFLDEVERRQSTPGRGDLLPIPCGRNPTRTG